MTGFLRFIGLMNAAVWFGASVFFLLGVAPAFFSAEMKKHFGQIWTGIIAFIVFGRYFALQYWCGAIALAHHLAEWVYLGKPLQRLTLTIVLIVFGFGLVGGLVVQPKLERLHAIKYGKSEVYSDVQKAQAARSMAIWHGASRVTGILSLIGLGVYLWRMGNPPNPPRFVPSTTFRS